MRRVFVLCQGYPSNESKYVMAFVHPRVKGYLSSGVDVSVISFSANYDYAYDGVNVFTVKSGYDLIKEAKDILLISHAPNIRHHMFFILKIWKYVSNIFFFFHGHEILSTKLYYPIPYFYNTIARNEYKNLQIYDCVKLPFMRNILKFFLRSNKCDLIFVSKWMLNAGMYSLKTNFDCCEKIHIINNGISSYIKEGAYNLNNYKADFVTIRPLDQSKYAIDLVVKCAIDNPSFSFHIYGRGKYFDNNEKPNNIVVFNDFLSPKDIPTILNSYKYALMPTRLDAQGVMMCEMAVYGMPLIASDIEICHEMLDNFENVIFIDNKNFNLPIDKLPKALLSPHFDFSFDNTIKKEIDLIKKYS